MIFVEREKLCFLGREEIKKFPSFRIQMMQVTEIQLITATAKRRLPSENIQSSSRTRQSLRRSRILLMTHFPFICSEKSLLLRLLWSRCMISSLQVASALKGRRIMM